MRRAGPTRFLPPAGCRSAQPEQSERAAGPPIGEALWSAGERNEKNFTLRAGCGIINLAYRAQVAVLRPLLGPRQILKRKEKQSMKRQLRDHCRVSSVRDRYRIPRGSGRTAHRADQPPHRAHEGEQARLPQQPWSAEDGRPPPQSARLSAEEGHRAVPRSDRPSGVCVNKLLQKRTAGFRLSFW